jgi:hypothetical protein
VAPVILVIVTYAPMKSSMRRFQVCCCRSVDVGVGRSTSTGLRQDVAQIGRMGERFARMVVRVLAQD